MTPFDWSIIPGGTKKEPPLKKYQLSHSIWTTRNATYVTPRNISFSFQNMMPYILVTYLKSYNALRLFDSEIFNFKYVAFLRVLFLFVLIIMFDIWDKQNWGGANVAKNYSIFKYVCQHQQSILL